MIMPRQSPVAEAAERSHLALRRAVMDVAVSLARAGVLSHSGHADLSARVGPDAVLLTALSRRRDLGPDDLAVVRLDGTVAEGDLAELSPEMTAAHLAVYRTRPRVGAVIHTHSPNLLAFAFRARPLPARYEPLVRLGQAEEVPVVPGLAGDPARLSRRGRRADRGTTGYPGRPGRRPRCARLRPGHRGRRLAPGDARRGGRGRASRRRARPLSFALNIAHVGDGRAGAERHAGGKTRALGS